MGLPTSLLRDLRLSFSILDRELLESIEESSCMELLFDQCIKYTKAKDVGNSINAISCIAGFLRLEKFYSPSLKRMKTLLHHSSKPFLRYQTAEKMLQSLEIISIMTEVPIEVTQMLKETDWVAELDQSVFKEKANFIHTNLSSLF